MFNLLPSSFICHISIRYAIAIKTLNKIILYQQERMYYLSTNLSKSHKLVDGAKCLLFSGRFATV